MDEPVTGPTDWSRSKVITGLILVAAMLAGVVLLLRSPTAASTRAVGGARTTITADPEAVDGTDTAESTVAADRSSDTLVGDGVESLSEPTTTAVPTGPVVVELVDNSRPTVTGGLTIDGVRHLPTTVWHPGTPGRHPLVVFAHGYEVGPMTYARFCAALAAHGYVVAAPSFPLADASRGNGLDREDIPNQAIDVDFVIDALRRTDPSIDSGPVAVIGHSDGGTVALLVAERPSSMHPDIAAAIAIAPDSITGDLTSSPPPLLIIHSIDDEISAFWNSEQAFASFTGPRWLLALEGAAHLPPVAGNTPWTPVIDQAVELFLAATLHAGAGTDLSGLTPALDRLDLSHVTTAG